MDINTKSQQIEFEVFPKNDKQNYSYLSGIKEDRHTESNTVNVVFSHQSVIIIFICVFLSLVASFTLGVEKGKLVAKESSVAEKLPVAPVSATPAESPQTIVRAQPQVAEKIQSAVEKPQIAAGAIAGENIEQKPIIAPMVIAQKENIPVKTGYCIQVATLNSESSAKSLSESLVKKGWSSFTRQSGKYVIVLAGNFSKKEEAQVKLKELKKTYADCFIRKI